MDNNYKEDICNIIDTLKELVIRELNTDLSEQEYDSLYAYCSGLIDNFKMDLVQGVVYAGE
mgnify:CR=1 FL=1